MQGDITPRHSIQTQGRLVVMLSIDVERHTGIHNYLFQSEKLNRKCTVPGHLECKSARPQLLCGHIFSFRGNCGLKASPGIIGML